MPALNAATLLTAWEQGVSQRPVPRALMLLGMTWPERSQEEWANVSIGERDGYLLRLRGQIFGSQIEAIAVCPKCGERVQLEFSTEAIGAGVSELSSSNRLLHVEADGFEVDCRLPTSADLIAMTSCGDVDGREFLLGRCIAIVRRDGAVVDQGALPDQLVKAVIDEMAQADQQAEVRIALACPVCPHRWSMLFDILLYLWNEINDWAQRLLTEVHALASAYGWSERDILAMSARRRRLYLEMLGS